MDGVSGSPRTVFRFGGFALDTGRGAVLAADGTEVPLRPKSFALLHLLVENAGRLLDRDTIMAAVWPDVIVTDDSITQCVKELRRALGDDAQRLIRTVPKRGYILDAEVETGGGASEAPWADLGAATAPPYDAPAEAAGAVAPLTLPPPAGPEVVRPHRLPGTAATAALAVLVLVVAAALWRGGAPGGGSLAGGEARPVPTATAPAPPPRGTAGTEATTASPRERAERLTDEAWLLSAPGRSRADILASRDMLERAVATDPTFPRAWAYLAITQASIAAEGLGLSPAEDQRAAERAAERALALAPDDAFSHAARGAVLEFQPDRLEEALAAYRRAVALDANQHRSRGKLGWLLILLGRAEEAEPYLRTSIEAAPAAASWRRTWQFQLGLARLLLGRGDHGAANFRESLCSQPGASCDIRTLHLAAALALDGKAEEARHLVGEIRQRRPDLTAEALRQRPGPSRNPVYLAQRERLFEGLALAGFPER